MKLMIMNYKPYEYELLMEKLNKLGQAGYTTNELSLITFFHKVNHPVYYQIDFYQSSGSTKREKQKNNEAFANTYYQKDLVPIYMKHNMFIFKSSNQRKIAIDWEEKKDVVSSSFRFLSLFAFFVSIVILSMVLYYSLQASFDKFMSYGMTFAFVGAIFMLATLAYRNYLNFYGMTIFRSRIQQLKPHFQLKKLTLLRNIYLTLFAISTVLIAGGLIEDTFNAKEFTQQDHHFITLQDLHFTEQTELSTQKYSGFFIPHTYISLEQNDDQALYIKEYQLSNNQRAQDIFDELKQTPKNYAANRIETDNNIIYGYYNDDLVSLIIMHDTSVTMIIPSFNLTSDYTQDIISFYQDS